MTGPSPEPKISVIVNNFKDLTNLERCLSSIEASSYSDLQVIVVDCKTDGLRPWLSTNFPKVQFIQLEVDVGPSGQRNDGLALVDSNSKYVCFIDNDVQVERNCFSVLVGAMEHDPDIGVIQPKLVKSNGELDNGGCYIDRVGYVHRIDYTIADEYVDERKQVSYGETAIILVRTETLRGFVHTEPFDPAYYIHYYDVDFCWRVLLLGKKIIFEPKGIAYHERGVSSGLEHLPDKNIYINTRNRLITLIKNYNSFNLLVYLPIFIILELGKSLYLSIFNLKHGVANVKAIFWVMFNMGEILERRKKSQKNRLIGDEFVQDSMLKLSFRRMYKDLKRNYDAI